MNIESRIKKLEEVSGGTVEKDTDYIAEINISPNEEESTNSCFKTINGKKTEISHDEFERATKGKEIEINVELID